MIAYDKDNAEPRPRQKDPFGGPDEYLMPGNCTDVEPPKFNAETHTCIFKGSKWVVAKIPLEPEPEEAEALTPEYQRNRLAEYGLLEEQIEFITENGLEAWQARVAEIKKKYPKE